MIGTRQLIDFLAGHPWQGLGTDLGADSPEIPGMLSVDERVMLSWLIANIYTGRGEIAELGAFLGASTVALAHGLRANRMVQGTEKQHRIHSFDRFVGEFEADFIREKTRLPVGDDNRFGHFYRQHIGPWAGLIRTVHGDIRQQQWIDKPIEILFVDVMKSGQLTDKVVNDFFPHLMAGESVVIMQDYLYPTLPYSTVVMEHFADYFERAGDTERNSVLFVNTRAIPAELAQSFIWDRLPQSLKLHYVMQALPKQRTHLQREFIAHQLAEVLAGKY